MASPRVGVSPSAWILERSRHLGQQAIVGRAVAVAIRRNSQQLCRQAQSLMTVSRHLRRRAVALQDILS